eukprot:102865_1
MLKLDPLSFQRFELSSTFNYYIMYTYIFNISIFFSLDFVCVCLFVYCLAYLILLHQPSPLDSLCHNTSVDTSNGSLDSGSRNTHCSYVKKLTDLKRIGILF